MKVLILTRNYPRKNALFNGIFIHQQVKALQQIGIECHVLMLYNWYPPFGLHRYHSYWRLGQELHETFFTEYEGVKIHPVPVFVPIPNFLFSKDHYDRDAKAITRYIKFNRNLQDADWIYAQFLTHNAFIAAKIKDELNMKLASMARGDDVHAWPEEKKELRLNFPLVFEKSDLLLANSKNLGLDTQKWMEPGKIREVHVVYNGIDTQKFRPAKSKEEIDELKKRYQLDPGTRYLACIGFPIALKGWNELYEAIKTLGKQFDGWKLLAIATQRNNRDAIDLVQKAHDMGIEDRVHCTGELPPVQVAEILRACDAFVLPSYNEGMANSLLEAMATGMPCIATNVGGHNEVIESEDEGILIKPKSVEELITAIARLTSDEGLRKKMGEGARQKMILFGDYVANSRRLLQLFEKYK